MKDDELIALAAECGLMPWVKHEHVGGTSFSATDEGIDGDLAGLIQFAELVAAHEREACAKYFEDHWRQEWTDEQIAAAIRARGQ